MNHMTTTSYRTIFCRRDYRRWWTLVCHAQVPKCYFSYLWWVYCSEYFRAYFLKVSSWIQKFCKYYFFSRPPCQKTSIMCCRKSRNSYKKTLVFIREYYLVRVLFELREMDQISISHFFEIYGIRILQSFLSDMMSCIFRIEWILSHTRV